MLLLTLTYPITRTQRDGIPKSETYIVSFSVESIVLYYHYYYYYYYYYYF